MYLDELERFQQIRIGNARDLEQYADLLDVAIINLQEAGQYHELGAGSLYIKLKKTYSNKTCWHAIMVVYSKMACRNQSLL